MDSTGKPEIREREKARLHAAAESDITTALLPSAHNAQESPIDYLSLVSQQHRKSQKASAPQNRTFNHPSDLALAVSIQVLVFNLQLAGTAIVQQFLGGPTHAELPEDIS